MIIHLPLQLDIKKSFKVRCHCCTDSGKLEFFGNTQFFKHLFLTDSSHDQTQYFQAMFSWGITESSSKLLLLVLKLLSIHSSRHHPSFTFFITLVVFNRTQKVVKGVAIGRYTLFILGVNANVYHTIILRWD